jgi:ketosteroid isomerase-like protein
MALRLAGYSRLMSQAIVETVRALWADEPVDLVAAFEDLALAPPLVAAVDPDTQIFFNPEAPGSEDPGFRGLEGLAEGWRDWLEPYECYVLEVEDYIDAGGGAVYVPARVRARTRRDGVAIEHEPAAVFTFRDGKIARLAFYLDRAEALEAAGLAIRQQRPSSRPT